MSRSLTGCLKLCYIVRARREAPSANTVGHVVVKLVHCPSGTGFKGYSGLYPQVISVCNASTRARTRSTPYFLILEPSKPQAFAKAH